MNEASLRQIEAARPDRSTWLSANAGSGKTRVLTDRVARLLLKGTPPQNILCLTYTKAAASEMQNRLFRRLGDWAMKPDQELRATLTDLGEAALDDDAFSAARRLFAQAIETPGGLRIQTIHSFCAVLLRRFPLEAGVTPGFEEMDDRAAERLQAQCLEDLSAEEPETVLAVARLSGVPLEKLAADIAGRRDDFRAVTEADLRAYLDLPAGLEMEDVLKGVFLGGEADLFATVADALAAGSSADKKAAPDFRDLTPPWNAGTLTVLEGICLFGAKAAAPFGAKIGKFPTKATQKALGESCARLDDLMARIETARPHRLALATLEKSLALNRFAAAWLSRYAAAKAARGWLDFDDLILGARDLLTGTDLAEWVLYRLDGGIDHILVDEAQDTSPTQWKVVEALSQQFGSGAGARGEDWRSIFVVGDRKQSIYSFQGADPEGIERMHDHFAARLGEGTLAQLELQHSFRSSPAVLGAVDAVFADGLGGPVRHLAFHEHAPGRVDLWPLIEQEDPPEDGNWEDPVDRPSPRDASVRLARDLAKTIRRMIDGHETLPDGKGWRRAIHAGDILILVRGRQRSLFPEIISACKSAGIDIAGADVLTLQSELAVQDILSLLRFLALPEDDLALAEALRSPLLGVSEDQLYRLSSARGARYLWQSLRKSAEHPGVMEILDDLLAEADFLRPFELLDRLLRRHRGRDRLLGRLGPECLDAIDALLAQALAYERLEVPSLTGFLAWFETGEVKIKRQAEGSGGRLRVMTVHGAKGLESPIVILPDTLDGGQGKSAPLLSLPDGPVVWRPNEAERPPSLSAPAEAEAALSEAERNRLLYVAMTRAESWLIVCGAGKSTAADKGWYGQVRAGLERLETETLETPAGFGVRYRTGEWDAGLAPVEPAADSARGAPELPDWATRPAPPPPPPARSLISPSGLGGAKVLAALTNPGEALTEEEATRRGSMIHLLLEHLPRDSPDAWAGLAPRLLAADAPDAATLEDVLSEAQAVLSDPGLADLWARPGLNEVALVAAHPSGARIAGAVDRLIVEDDRVLAIDYKSNREIPEDAAGTPEGLLRQMGAYGHALAQIYPERRIETAILWTRGPRLDRLDADAVRAAFARAAP